MTFHVIGLPHTQTTGAYNICAFTANVVKFCDMMHARGHKVILYAGEENEAACDELVTCITKKQQDEVFSQTDWYAQGLIQNVDYDPALPHWQLFNGKAIEELGKRIQPKDFICIISGWSQQSIINAFPSHMSVEYAVGYEGVYAKYRVFASYAWMHAIYAKEMGPSSADGKFFDAVIPHYFPVKEFPFSAEKDDYYLFMSRMIPRKGYEIAIQAAERAGKKLIIAGIGGDRPKSPNVEYVGFADKKKRGELMSKAQAVFMPTLYLEMFGMVAAEAMLCGTPVISTDWGAFPEIVRQGIDGFRCRSMSEFVQAMEDVKKLNYAKIRKGAIARYSSEVVGLQYEQYFERLLTLWHAGFYA